MTEQIESIQDLVRLLETHPEWRARLRPLLLANELLTLPDHVRALTDRIAELAAAQARTEQHLNELAVAQTRSEQRLSKVEEVLVQLAVAQTRAEERLVRIEKEVSILKGDGLELRYGKQSVAAYGRWLRRSRILSHEQVYELLDDAVDAERLTMNERDQIAQADVLVRGKDRATDQEVYLVVEVSWGVGVHDVERAAARA